MSTDDQELVRAAAGGDTAAFAELYDRHASRVFGVLTRMLRRSAEAEDALQETFLRAWKSLDRYDAERCSVGGWLCLIARSRAIDLLRQRRALGGADEVERSPTDDPATTDVVEEEERGNAVASAVERLPEAQRRLIRLAFFDGLTHEEIAARTGEPLGTVKSRIRLGMNRLRDMVSAHEARDR